MRKITAKNRVVRILIERDSLTEEEAVEMVKDAQSELYEALQSTSCVTPEEVIENELGLEPDYILDII
jgi:predicted Zn-ribbon and HTH transcriptional regulator